jgi:hypothetical protein
MEGAAAAGETKTMRDRMRIFVLAVALALSVGVMPAKAWPGGDNGDRPAAGWWEAVVDALATLFRLDRPLSRLAAPAKGDGSVCIDPAGSPVCPASPSTLEGDGSCGIDPWGNPAACQPPRW